jgi:CBS domain-containing protein
MKRHFYLIYSMDQCSREGTMATVENLLKTKGHLVFSVTPEDTVLDALKLMAEKNIGAVMVMG